MVSAPSVDLFEQQPESYRNAVLPPNVRARVAVEAAHPQSWHKYVGLDGATVCMNSYGASAPAKILFEKFGLYGSEYRGSGEEGAEEVELCSREELRAARGRAVLGCFILIPPYPI